MGAPFFIVFAGVNGAGKTTFFHSGLWKTADMPSRMARVNPDEIARTLKGDQSKTREEFEAATYRTMLRQASLVQPRNDPERTRSLEESGAGSRFGISHLHVLHWR